MPVENFQSIARYEPMADQDAPEKPAKPSSKLDSEEAKSRHRRLWGWLLEEQDRQSVNRYQMAIDEDFRDNLQWAEEDIRELMERYQAPLTFNMIHPQIGWMTGMQKRMRMDWSVLPREKGDNEAANAKTELLKYVSDQNRVQWSRSLAFEDCVTAGLGWLEDGIRSDPTEEPIYSAREHWRNVWYDSLGKEMDGSDWRYLFRQRWTDLDIACALWPHRESLLKHAARKADTFPEDDESNLWYLGARMSSRDLVDDGYVLNRRTYTSGFGWAQSQRERVQLFEAWYRMPVKSQVLMPEHKEVDFLRGEIYDPKNKLHAEAVKEEICSLYDAIRMRTFVSIMTEGGFLEDMPSPYRHNRFSLTPVWCYRRKRDGAPYGLVRLMRDPQEDFNKRRSKALFLLSVNRVVMDEGAVEDIEEVRTEASRPDAVLVKKAGRELKIESAPELAVGHMQMAEQDIQIVHMVSGITPEQLGQDTNAQSGRAVIAKQQQGSLVREDPFDNLRFAVQIQGESQLSLIEQYMGAPKVLRILGRDGKYDYITANEPNDDGTFTNDVTRSKADFVIAAQDYSETVRQFLFERMMDLLGRLATMAPQVALSLLSSAVELIDLPNRDQLVAKIRSITGEVDPDEPTTPEEAQLREQQAAEAQRQKQMQEEAQQLALDEQAARVEKLRAEAAKAAEQAKQVATEVAMIQAGVAGGPAVTEREQQLMDALEKASKEFEAFAQKSQQQLQQAEQALQQAQLQAANKDSDSQRKAQVALAGKAMEVQSREAVERARIAAGQQTDREKIAAGERTEGAKIKSGEKMGAKQLAVQERVADADRKQQAQTVAAQSRLRNRGKK